MPTLGPTELIIILLIVLFVFGVGRLPEIGRAVGQGVRELQTSASLIKEEQRRLSEEDGEDS